MADQRQDTEKGTRINYRRGMQGKEITINNLNLQRMSKFKESQKFVRKKVEMTSKYMYLIPVVLRKIMKIVISVHS